jgi:hypothetical protein
MREARQSRRLSAINYKGAWQAAFLALKNVPFLARVFQIWLDQRDFHVRCTLRAARRRRRR